MLEWRLKAYRRWLAMEDPTRRKESQRWAMVHYPDINYQDIVYYSAPKQKQLDSLDEVDPEILATYQKLGIPLVEQQMLAGVAVDAVFDSVSVPPRSRTSWPSWALSSAPCPSHPQSP